MGQRLLIRFRQGDVEARSSDGMLRHSPSRTHSSYTSRSVKSQTPTQHHTSSSVLHSGNYTLRNCQFTFLTIKDLKYHKIIKYNTYSEFCIVQCLKDLY